MIYVRYEQNRIKNYGILKDGLINRVDGRIGEEWIPTAEVCRLEDVKLLAPCEPTKIVAVGLNYADHAKEMNEQIPPEPKIFIKPATAVIGPGDVIQRPDSERVDYEGELAIVIKKRAKDVPVERALEYVLGYTCLNDVTARGLQSRDGQWTRAKGFDTFCPIGPVITDEIDPNNVSVQTRLNGEVKQDSDTSHFIFRVEEMICFISHVMTLLPGDVITTGTPSGMGPMQDGDSVEICIEGIGTLRNCMQK